MTTKKGSGVRFVWGTLLLVVMWVMVACGGQYSPKPRGYHRIAFPEKQYQTYQSGCPFVFEYPGYAQIQPDQTRDAQCCWMDMVFTEFNARLHLSYLPINNRDHFDELLEDARALAYSHTVKATAIRQHPIQIPAHRIQGVLYEIHGNTASSLQFYVTDSARHYLRGALYFDERPRVDSIQPVIDFIRADLDRFIQTVYWQ